MRRASAGLLESTRVAKAKSPKPLKVAKALKAPVSPTAYIHYPPGSARRQAAGYRNAGPVPQEEGTADQSASRGPGSTADVDYWTSKDVRDVMKSHLNYVVADTKVWEQSAAYILDTHPRVDAFVKNAGLGFAIPYLHNGQPHDYIPDFIVRLNTEPVTHLIIETKGFDDLADVKAAAAERWVAAVNADGQHGTWRYAMARKVSVVRDILDGL